MRRQPSEERDDNTSAPLLPKRSPMPERMPSMPPCIYNPGMYQQPIMYPPGNEYNPIGVPPSQPSTPISTPSPIVPTPVEEMPIEFIREPGPPVMVDTNYLQGYLKTMIGQYVKVEFILGTNMLIDREGVLMEVGVDHIVIQEPETDDLVVADLYSIKFVKIFL